MKNNFLILAILLFISEINYSQVGIGTTAPASSLDIVATNQSGTTTNVDGILIPRVTRERAQSMAGTSTSTMIFVNEVITGTASGTTLNVTSTGFYFFNGMIWEKITTGLNTNWDLTGNSGTSAGTNYIGTNDSQDFRIKTNLIDRWNISTTNNGQLQSYSLGSATVPPYSFQSDTNTGIFSPTTDNLSLTTNGTESLRLNNDGNITIGATYAPSNPAPSNGLRVQGKSVFGKASGEDTRDYFSSHTSSTSYSNVTGYPNATASRAVSGYADAGGMGVFGFSNRNGYGVVGLTQANALSPFIQTGEGVLGQADGAIGATSIPMGIHGIIDETTPGLWQATGVVGENNNISTAGGLSGGPYLNTGAASGVYGNYASRFGVSFTDRYVFGVVGDVLLLGTTTIPDASGGVLGCNGSGGFGIIGYKSRSGTLFSVYGGGQGSSAAAGNTGKISTLNDANNHIGLGINGGFMGGYVKGNQYGLMTKGDEFGMYVQGKTITNEPIIQVTDDNSNKKIITYTPTSTDIDISTRGIGKLNNGETFVPFKESFKSIVSSKENVNITITPTAATNGVYISEVTSEGFYVKENLNGRSNATFNWTAIGTRKGYENGIELSETITNPDFDKNMNEVMNNDGTESEGKPIYFDGSKIQFERIPEGIEKENVKKYQKIVKKETK